MTRHRTKNQNSSVDPSMHLGAVRAAMSDISTAIINNGYVPVGNKISSVSDKYLSSPKKNAAVGEDEVSHHMQKDGVDSTDNSIGQKDVEEVQRHEVASANNSFRLEDKKEIKESLATATMLKKKLMML